MLTITQKEYQHILRRQEKIEAEFNIVKKILAAEIREEKIKPAVLKRWDRISRDLDQGKGRVFDSPIAMRRWLKQL